MKQKTSYQLVPKKLTFALQRISTLIALTAASNVFAAPVINYGENTTKLINSYQQQKLHILQIGDSHTAGDYFTEQLRKRLQADIGDGGIGYAPPYKVRGQRVARHGYDTLGWNTLSSKYDGGNFPLGGFIAQTYSPNPFYLTSEYYFGKRMNADILVASATGTSIVLADDLGTRTKKISAGKVWQRIQTPMQFPLQISSENDLEIGGFWLTKPKGGVVSAMGINGSQIKQWHRWQPNIAAGLQQSNAQLVVLAYGTNEAFSNDVSDFENSLTQSVRQIRQALPSASVLIIGAPESLKSKSGRCGNRPEFLDTVQFISNKVAKQERTLFWSWQDAMGGYCSMKQWMRQNLASKDAVHFTRLGYETAANDLYDNLLANVISLTPNTNYPSNTQNIQAQPSANIPRNILEPQTNNGSGSLCAADGTNCFYIK